MPSVRAADRKKYVNLMHPTLLLQLNGVVPHDNLVLIKMRPDEHGRFGFNVKVRADIRKQEKACLQSFSLFSLCVFWGFFFCQNPQIVNCIMTNSLLLA